MEDRQQPFNEDVKKRRLDELFADEPYLSATMKARRLHEKLEEFESRDGAVQELPREAFVADLSARPGPLNDEAAERDALRPQQMLRLPAAKEYLRARPGVLEAYADRGILDQEVAARLRRFRDEVLPKWREALSGSA